MVGDNKGMHCSSSSSSSKIIYSSRLNNKLISTFDMSYRTQKKYE